MTKILFFITDLEGGGAEKTLVNLINHMDRSRFDIHLLTLFPSGVNEKALTKGVRVSSVFPFRFRGISHLCKLVSPRLLHRLFIREHYDVEVAFLEGMCSRIVSACPAPDTRRICWVHTEFQHERGMRTGFRTAGEARRCYERFHSVACVSTRVMDAFLRYTRAEAPQVRVLYNVNDTGRILQLADRPCPEEMLEDDAFRIISVAKIEPLKGMDRLVRVHARLREVGLPVHTYVLGQGPEKGRLSALLRQLNIEDSFSFLGYKENPYKYMRHADLYVCSSHVEGFSTSVTESLICGTPVCTTEVSGMKEMLGNDNRYGVVVRNDEQALFSMLRTLISDRSLMDYYRDRAEQRGRKFNGLTCARAIEDFIEQTCSTPAC